MLRHTPGYAQIGWRIVPLDIIEMVDLFSGDEPPSETFLRDDSVFISIAADISEMVIAPNS